MAASSPAPSSPPIGLPSISTTRTCGSSTFAVTSRRPTSAAARQSAEYVGAADEYDAGHIPGADLRRLDRRHRRPRQPRQGRRSPPRRGSPQRWRHAVSATTPTSSCIDHTGGHFATRLWWALRYYGHDRVAVLDGGFNKWLAEGRPTHDRGVPPRSPPSFTPRPRPELSGQCRSRCLAAIDRPASTSSSMPGMRPSTAGRSSRGSRGGHIPGAVNISSKSLVNADGTWKSDAELSPILARRRRRPGRPRHRLLQRRRHRDRRALRARAAPATPTSPTTTAPGTSGASAPTCPRKPASEHDPREAPHVPAPARHRRRGGSEATTGERRRMTAGAPLICWCQGAHSSRKPHEFQSPAPFHRRPMAQARTATTSR